MKLVDLTLVLHKELDKSYMVSETGEPDSVVFLPKSQVEKYDQKGTYKFWEIYEFAIPDWLATEKGLV